MKITNKLIAEFIGTLFLVAAALLGGKDTLPGLAPAVTLCLCIYAMGHISGAHFNPAVSLGVFLRGRMTQKELIEYVCAQAAGAGVAVLIWLVLRNGFAATAKTFEDTAKLIAEVKGADAAKIPFMKGLVAEFFFTFLLVSTVLHVATTKALANNSFYGLAIGLCVLAGASCVGWTGGAFNPAVGLGLVLSGKYEIGTLFVYLLGCFGGGIAAAVVFRILLPGEHSPAVTAPASAPASPPPPAE